MNKKLATIVLMVGLAVPVVAFAQPRETKPTSIAALLERRIPDELAAEGVLLSRRGLSLKVEQVGATLRVSLIDVDSGRVVASTKVDRLPEDREAVVASVTHVVADLVAQSAPAKSDRPGPAPARALTPAANEQGLAARQRSYRQQSIHFDEMAVISGNQYGVSTSLTSVPRRGEMNEVLETEDFFRLVGRDDLAEHFVHRRHVGKVVSIAGVAAIVAGTIITVSGIGSDSAGQSSALIGGLVLTGAGSIGLSVGILVYASANRVSANEAKSMASEYNARLRQRLHVPEAQRSFVRDVKLASYAAPSGAGLALRGQF